MVGPKYPGLRLGVGPLPSVPHVAKSVPQNLKLRKIVFIVWHPNYLLNLLIFPCMVLHNYHPDVISFKQLFK